MRRRPQEWSQPAIERSSARTPESRWAEILQVELPPLAEGESGPWKQGQVELRTRRGAPILRQGVKDPRILEGRSRVLDLDPSLLTGNDAAAVAVRRQREDGSWTEWTEAPVSDAFRRRSADLVHWILSLEIPERTVSFCPIGGLANQLYQAGAMLGYSRRQGIPWVCEAWKPTSPSMVAPRPTYWDSVFRELVRRSDGRRRDPRKARNYGDPSFTYTEIPVVHDHQILWGHWLTYKYFHPERAELLDLLYGVEWLQAEVDEAERRLRAMVPRPDTPLVSVHVRRGDSLLNRSLTRMNMRYYDEAMAHFDGASFAVFSDDIPWCRETFRRPDVVFVEGNADTVDLFLMARCDHHVIANSTYSWWAAYLNRAPSPTVIYPMPWFAGQKRERDMSDFFLPDWIRFDVVEDED